MRWKTLLVAASCALATGGAFSSCSGSFLSKGAPPESAYERRLGDRSADGAAVADLAGAEAGPFTDSVPSLQRGHADHLGRPGEGSGGFTTAWKTAGGADTAPDRMSGGTGIEAETPQSETSDAGASGAASTPAAPDAPAPARKIVYRGFLRLEVKRVRKAADAIQRMAEKAGGYVESLSGRAIVVRVPGTDFETAMDLFQSAGRVLDRKVQAYDVTARFTDLKARLEVSEGAKARLLQLLESEKDPKERLRIISEVKRLTEKVESIRATLETLKNLVDYYTITIELVPVTESQAPQDKRSPFRWVHRLQAHRATLRSERERQSLKSPRGFVQFDRARAWFAQAADGTAIRIGYVANEPRGDARFWAKAIDFEMEGRDEVRTLQETQGPLEVRVYRDKDLEPRFFVVGIYASPEDEDITVVEVFFPDEDAYRTHQKAVRASLGTLKLR